MFRLYLRFCRPYSLAVNSYFGFRVDYRKSIEYLFGLQRFGIKLGLDNITRLLRLLGNPHASLKCVHVAGTNGKGSTCAFLQSICMRAGYKVGLYTSPHLIDFTERIKINDTCIPKTDVAELVSEIKQLCEKNELSHVTFFEFSTAMALHYFRIHRADLVIIETGMGGRWDATNIITPLVSIITSISMDHEKYLGKRILAIAAEKSGIIKPGIPLVCGVGRKNVREIILKRSNDLGSPCLIAGKDFKITKCDHGKFSFRGCNTIMQNMKCGLLGGHQQKNAALSIVAAVILRNLGYNIDSTSIREGILFTSWPGRFEQLRSAPAVIADGAHNPDGWRALKITLSNCFQHEKLILLLGVMEDKDVKKMLKILTRDAYAIIVCRPKVERAAGRETLEKFISFSEKKRVFWHDNSAVAYNKALSLAGEKDLICITGSLFLVGELREIITKRTASASGRIAL
jgi:dihydrofolate synthase / folylpolyglutamate synthase